MSNLLAGRSYLGNSRAGTPNMAGAIGLAAAVDYQKRLGMDAIEAMNRN